MQDQACRLAAGSEGVNEFRGADDMAPDSDFVPEKVRLVERPDPGAAALRRTRFVHALRACDNGKRKACTG